MVVIESSKNIMQKSMSYPEAIPVGKQDESLPYIYPITGSLDSTTQVNMLDCLCKNIFKLDNFVETPTYSDVLKGIKRPLKESLTCHIQYEMNSASFAVLFNRKLNITHVNLDKRNCKRITFLKDTVEELEDIFFDSVKNNIIRSSNIEIDDIRLDPTHGDILYYTQNGKFDIHRDGVNTFPFDDVLEEGWRMYSLIICLESNLNGGLDGNTIVYLPSQSFLAYNKYGNYYSKQEKDMFRHEFAESCIKGKYLLFPAESLHASAEIIQDQGFKLAMKLDVWIKEKSHFDYNKKLDKLDLLKEDYYYSTIKEDFSLDTYGHYLYTINFPNICNCKRCNSKYRSDIYTNNLMKVLKLNIFDVVNEIVSFIIDLNYRPRCDIVPFNKSKVLQYQDDADDIYYMSDLDTEAIEHEIRLSNLSKVNRCTCLECLNITDREEMYESEYYDQDYESDCNGYQYDFD